MSYLIATSTLHKSPGAWASFPVLPGKQPPEVLHHLGDSLVHPQKNASPKLGYPMKTASEKDMERQGQEGRIY